MITNLLSRTSEKEKKKEKNIEKKKCKKKKENQALSFSLYTDLRNKEKHIE